MEYSNEEIVVSGLVPTGNVGAGLSTGFACLCVSFWANAMGLCTPSGFTLAIGVVLLGFFVIYFIGGLYFLKQGGTLMGTIFITFAAVFGLFGGGVYTAGGICAVFGIPVDFTIASLAFVLAGLFLLFCLPAMKGFGKTDFLCFMFAGIGVAAFGIAGLGMSPAVANMIGGWTILASGILSYYGALVGVFASVGKALPTGKPFF